MKYEEHYLEGLHAGLQYYEIRNDLKPLVLLHAQAVDSTSFSVSCQSWHDTSMCMPWTATAMAEACMMP